MNDTPLATSAEIYDRVAMHPDAVRGFEQNHIEAHLSTPEQATAAVAQNWLPVINRYDLRSTETAALVDLDRVASAGPVAADVRAGWAVAAKEALLQEFGAERVGQAFADAKAFIRQDPQLQRFAARGFGDSPQLVLMAARLGNEARKSGRLK